MQNYRADPEKGRRDPGQELRFGAAATGEGDGDPWVRAVMANLSGLAMMPAHCTVASGPRVE